MSSAGDHILVSTTVIEVGVDVPNSSIIMIENSERFGLSQLPPASGQGRARRLPVILGYKLSADGKRRLKAMKDTDGFKISKIDLEIRGPGDFLGTRQSGIPEFLLANIVEDQDILKMARRTAFRIMEEDPGMETEANRVVRVFYQQYLREQKGLGIVA
ncbi:MAG: hypothetical protein R3B93_02915 [Bacteroidia bacterium]